MVTTRPITVEEFEAMPLDGLWELIDGELIAVSPSAEKPSHVSAVIAMFIGQHVRAHRLGRTYTAEGGFVLFPNRATVRAPDVAFVRAERLPQGEERKHFARLAPDFAVEVLSPSDRMAEALGKVTMYLEAGVQLVWLVDPAEETVSVFRPDASPKTLGIEDTLDGQDVLPGLQVAIRDIFSDF